MSSYRRVDASLAITHDVPDAVYRYRTVRGGARTQSGPATGNSEAETYKHRRKSAPADIPLPRTLKWADELPPRVKPVALIRQFPRIANLIAASWDDLVQFEIYMDSLLTDKRGGRRGFPGDVITELGALDIYRHTVRECGIPAIPWSDTGKRG